MTGDALALTGIFLGGMALNLTPCVYPMMTVTASIFSRGEKTSLGLSFARAFVYVLGICVMYSALGTVAAVTGGFFGAVLQSAAVRFLIAALLLALALAMLGVYRFELPASLVSRLGGRRVGFAGLFVSGLLVGVFAAPCIGPPVVALLAHVAERRDPVYGFWLFFVMAAGLGFPYLVLGTFSHLIKALPKSGAWLVWVEKLFGVILLGFAAFYFSLAVGASDILPAKRMPADTPAAQQDSGIAWKRYTPDVLKAALASGKPVVLDFYADWCLPCQEMEAVTYRNAEVIRGLERFEAVKVDLTDAGNEAEMALAERYQVMGIPTLIFFDAQGQEMAELRAIGYIGPSEFNKIIKQIPDSAAL